MGTKYITSSDNTYKVYTALLTQTGGTEPVAEVLENTLGFTPTWVYNGVGTYSIVDSSFLQNKTTVNVFQNVNGWSILFPSYILAGGAIYLNCVVNGTTQDNILSNTCIEIKVYN